MFSTSVSLLSAPRTPSPNRDNEESESDMSSTMSVGSAEIGKTYSDDPQTVRTNRENLQEEYERLVDEHRR